MFQVKNYWFSPLVFILLQKNGKHVLERDNKGSTQGLLKLESLGMRVGNLGWHHQTMPKLMPGLTTIHPGMATSDCYKSVWNTSELVLQKKKNPKPTHPPIQPTNLPTNPLICTASLSEGWFCARCLLELEQTGSTVNQPSWLFLADFLPRWPLGIAFHLLGASTASSIEQDEMNKSLWQGHLQK